MPFDTFETTSAALLAALTVGIADFLGGRATDRIGAAATVVVVQVIATALVGAIVLVGSMALPEGRALWLSIVAGIADGFALMLLYKGLAVGRTAIVAPVTGVSSLSVPVLAEALFITWPGAWNAIGMLLAATAIVLVSQGRHRDGQDGALLPSVAFGLSAGLMFGATTLALGLVPSGEGTGALLVMRAIAGLIGAAALALSWRSVRWQPSGLGLAAATGLFDGVGLLLFVYALTHGAIGVAAALLSLYSGVTILLGVLVLKERIGRVQLVGLAVSATAALMLSSGGGGH